MSKMKMPIDLHQSCLLNMAIDLDTLLKTLLAGISEPAKGQYVREYVLGYNPNIKPYAYDILIFTLY